METALPTVCNWHADVYEPVEDWVLHPRPTSLPEFEQNLFHEQIFEEKTSANFLKQYRFF